MNRQTQNDHPLDDTLRERYSPRAFRTEPIATDVLLQLLEAARWAPSSYNQQPWRFIVATQDDPEAYEKLFGVINESNQRWAGNAPVLMLTMAEIEHGDRTNRNAHHDVGQAVAYLTVQATALGLACGRWAASTGRQHSSATTSRQGLRCSTRWRLATRQHQRHYQRICRRRKPPPGGAIRCRTLCSGSGRTHPRCWHLGVSV